jgi:pyridinium-3,5-bisthiocarboxylic acid mononucleotide nickel chelatase
MTDLPYELTTPTGAAIIRTCSSGMLSAERMVVGSVGYGAGTREMAEVPNLLRVMIAELPMGAAEGGMMCLETNIDDMNPEIYPYLIAKLLEGGAADAYLVPMVMKKGRPGVMVGVLAEKAKADVVLDIIFRETSTLGVRMYGVERRILEREERVVETEYGRVRVKVVRGISGERYHAEYEECRRIAEEYKIPLKEVYRGLDRGFFREETAKRGDI